MAVPEADYTAPEFAEVWSNYPKEGLSDLKRALGGNLDKYTGSNASALKVSVALARSGFTLPSTNRHTPEDLVDSEGHILQVEGDQLAYYLNKHLSSAKKLSRPAEMLAGKTGIVYFGDADVFDLFNVSETAGVSDEMGDKNVSFWELK
mmetsp:Transcript_10388/g.14038  ORF Transcript_10388/g.14038 Transcript_10388/m.14038 type:complete len:149 (-) Transcript_10388:73-519(-)